MHIMWYEQTKYLFLHPHTRSEPMQYVYRNTATGLVYATHIAPFRGYLDEYMGDEIGVDNDSLEFTQK